MYRFLYSNFFYILNSFCKICLEIFIFNRQIRRILKGNLGKWYLKKYIKIVNKSYCNDEKITESPHIIWQYWEQGVDNAPQIVKQCISSVEKYKNGNKHIIIDKESVKNYISIPQYIIDMNNRGIIKSAHYSDYIRTALLEQYGGTWIDATVLLTDNLPNYITEAELFLFQNELSIDLDGLNIANYFISAKPHNEFIKRMKLFLEIYWKKNNFVNNYFFYLHAFTLFTQSTEKLKVNFKKVPFFSFLPVQRFQTELFDKYQEDRWKQIKTMSFAHKLSYKINHMLKHKENTDFSGTFYERLLKGELE